MGNSLPRSSPHFAGLQRVLTGARYHCEVRLCVFYFFSPRIHFTGQKSQRCISLVRALLPDATVSIFSAVAEIRSAYQDFILSTAALTRNPMAIIKHHFLPPLLQALGSLGK